MTRSFTKFVAAIILTLSFSSTTFAQDTNNDIIRPITKQGSAAFLFTLQGLGTFGLGAPTIGTDNVTTAGAGMKYYVSDDLALRVLLAFNNTSDKANDTTSVQPGTTQFGVGIGGEFHFRPLYSTSPYVGAQISFTNTSTDNDLQGDAKDKTVRNSFAIVALAGFDWFVARGIAVGAEYSLGFASSGGTRTQGSVESGLGTRTTIGISGGGNVHAVVYF